MCIYIYIYIYIYTVEYYSAIERNKSESVELRWMNLEPVIESEVNQIVKNKYRILMHIYGSRKMLLMYLFLGHE